MSKKEKEKKLTIPCCVCGAKVYLTPQELEEDKAYGQYILRSGEDNALTAIQAGTLCESCLSKPLENRVVKK